MTFIRIYFFVFGLALAGSGIALLVNFRGLGTYWEDRTNELSAEVNRLARLPWPHNPSMGPAWRPATGVFALLLGGVMVITAAVGAVH